MSQTQRSNEGGGTNAPSVSVTISNKSGAQTGKNSPKGQKDKNDSIQEDGDEVDEYEQVQENDVIEDRPGRLKMADVKQLSDDPDQVIDSLKNVDLGMQELDVLIELAKQLKSKREALFPETGSILNSELFQQMAS